MFKVKKKFSLDSSLGKLIQLPADLPQWHGYLLNNYCAKPPLHYSLIFKCKEIHNYE